MSFADLQSGWLHKLSWVNIHRSWRKRYFVLGDKELRYYKHQGDIRPTGIVDLKHYRDVTPCATKQSEWSFRIESGCRHHFSHILHADNETDREIWVEAIRINIKKQHSLHSCHHNDSYYYDESQAINTSNNNDSVLDKWLERLDLQEDNNNNNSNSKSSPSSINSPTCHPISTSLPHHYTYSNNSAATISCFDFPPESVSPTTASPSSTVTPSPSSPGETNHNSRTSMLANAFAINARSRLRRRVTTNSSSSSSLEQQPHHYQHTNNNQQPSSPRSSNETTTSHRDNEWSALELFHFEEDAACNANNNNNNSSSRPPSISSAASAASSQQQQQKYNNFHTDTFCHVINDSMEVSVIPPCLPPPTSPLPPPPRTTTVHRRLSEHTNTTHPATSL